MVTVAILYMHNIIDTLMWVVFEQKYVKLSTFILFFSYFTLTNAIALIVTFIMIEAPCNSTNGINDTINFLIHIIFVSY